MNAQIKLNTLVDELAIIKAQIADLETRQNEIRELLIASGMTSIDGDLHTVRISQQAGRTSVDWKAIAEKFNPSRQLITAHTSQGKPFHVVKVIGRV